jgi:deferrochelatase/peroxidase EfeB
MGAGSLATGSVAARAGAGTSGGSLAARGPTGGGAPTRAPDLNAFTFDADPAGHRCPIGAHIRRTNPRTADLPPGGAGVISQLIRTLGLASQARAQDLAASTRFHRVLRRGREYGVQMTPEQALGQLAPDIGPRSAAAVAPTPVSTLAPAAAAVAARMPAPGATPAQPGAAESGLHFVCLNANIQRQFEFVQSAWIMSTKFNGLHEESDPLLGNRLPGPAGTRCDYFTMPRADGPTRRLEKLPQFVTVAGGAYFFLPGIRALRFLAASGAG